MKRDVEVLQRTVLTMAGYVEEAVFSATQSLLERDTDRAQTVIDQDEEIDRMENDVQEECLRVLALYAPVATDLRQITTVLLISTDLERMGDLAVGIAECAIELASPSVPRPPQRLKHMAHKAIEMVRLALDAYVRSDATIARQVIQMDDQVDADNDAIIEAVLGQMKQSPHDVDTGVSLFNVVRYMERIADHATNIAEDVVYMVEGQMVRHLHTNPTSASMV
jgi:phosphate transport system protein